MGKRIMDLSRRDLMAGAGAAAFAALADAPAQAFAPQAGKQNAGFYRYKLGAFEITAVTDGSATFPLADGFVKNVSKDEVNKALEAANLAKDQMTIVFTPIVVNTGTKLVVVDTGYGPAMLEKSGGKNGQFHSNLVAAGIDRGAVDAVIISHFHGDHINGLVTADGKPSFANAEILVPAPEWKFWMDDGNMTRAPDAAKPAFQNARRVFDALGNKVTQYEPGKDVVPGIQAVATHGHTPGHVSLTIGSGSDTMFVTCDLTNRPELFLANPGWHLMYDMDAAMAEATRRKMFDMVVADKMRVQGFHYPFPANGRIEKTDKGYRFAPTPWQASL